MNPRTNTCFIYLRISPKEKTQPGFHLGIDAQRTKCIAMAAVKGWTVPEENIFIDDDCSGSLKREKRPGLDAMLRRIEKDKNSAVIVATVDRLSRNLKYGLGLIETITKNNAFISCMESFDTTTAIGMAMLQITLVFAELERGRAIERTTEGLAALKARDMQYGTVPYGLQRGEPQTIAKGDKTLTRYPLIPNAAEQEVVGLVKGLRGQGISIRGIAKELNRREIPTRSAGKVINHKGTMRSASGLWSKTAIVRILQAA